MFKSNRNSTKLEKEKRKMTVDKQTMMQETSIRSCRNVYASIIICLDSKIQMEAPIVHLCMEQRALFSTDQVKSG
jgi:hypothetical protein